MGDRHQRQAEWEQRYRAGHLGWDRGDASPALAHWLERGEVPIGRVLVPGCGHGHEVVRLAEAGCRVTAVDIAAPAVTRLSRELARLGLHAEVVQADLLHWQPPAPFDAVYEQTCLCALDPTHWQEYAARIGDWLCPGGRLLALFMQTGRAGGPPFDCPLPAMHELFTPPDWQWPDAAALSVPHPNGLVEQGFALTRS